MRIKINSKGLSLVELVLVIVFVGFLAILIASIPNSIGLIGKSTHVSQAREAASKKVEELRQTQYTNLTLTGGPVGYFDPSANLLPYGSAEYSVDDCSSPDPLCSNGELVKKVTVTIKWKEEDRDQKVELTTLVSEGGLI